MGVLGDRGSVKPTSNDILYSVKKWARDISVPNKQIQKKGEKVIHSLRALFQNRPLAD